MSGKKNFQCSDAYKVNFFNKLQKFKENFHDVKICVDGIQIPAHRNILSMSSQYFEAMFTSGLKECHEDTVTITNVSSGTMELLIKFCYTGEIELNDGNVQEISEAADLMQFDVIKTYTSQYMIKQLNVFNCIEISLFAEKHRLLELLNWSNAFIANNLEVVSESVDFTTINAEFLATIFKRKETSESNVFPALEKWFKHREQEREAQLLPLLKLIRIPNLDPTFTEKVLIPFCVEHKCEEFLVDILRFRCKEAAMDENVIAVYGDADGNNEVENVEIYHSRLNMWSPFDKKRLTISRIYDYLFIYTDFDFGDNATKVYKSDPSTGTVRKIATFDMDLEEFLITNEMVFKSTESNETETSIYRYRPDMDNELINCGRFSTERLNSAISDIFDGNLYIIGGLNENGDMLSSVDRHSFKDRLWNECESMQAPRCYGSVAILCGYMYVIGGKTNEGVTASVERYDPNRNSWTFVAPLPVACYYAICANTEKFLYVAGGTDENDKDLNLFFRYDPTEDEWTELAPLNNANGNLIAIDIWHNRQTE